mmetsp:Transcript_84109/g.234575  ORF Transcript_84109/g.234575 Transcript_84109/m.234575 type:complete len:153 (-) Transcript_84109:85-543(-)
MSSIQEAIYRDLRRGKGPAQSFVALSDKQERQGETTTDDFHERLQERRLEERKRRAAEGGICGGFNDRQDVSSMQRTSSASLEEGDCDEFGRRVKKASGEQAASKSERAKAALERLRQRAVKNSEKSDSSGRRERSRDRSKSRGRSRSDHPR